MGRNKKKKSAAVCGEDDASSGAGTPRGAPNDEAAAQSDTSSVSEQRAAKKKMYRGNKLNRQAGGKGKKEKPSGPQPAEAPNAPNAPDNAAKNDGEKNESGALEGAVDALGEQMADDLVVSRHEPVEVLYCPICTFPAEMCEYSGMYEQCRPWLLEHAKELAEAEERGRKRRALTERERLERLVRGNGTKKAIERIVVIEVSQRKGRKMTTSVKGLDLFGLNLVDFARECKKLFSCGAGVKSSEELKQNSIDIQGNVVERLIELLPEQYNIPREAIYRMEDKKKVKCYPDA